METRAGRVLPCCGGLLLLLLLLHSWGAADALRHRYWARHWLPLVHHSWATCMATGATFSRYLELTTPLPLMRYLQTTGGVLE